MSEGEKAAAAAVASSPNLPAVGAAGDAETWSNDQGLSFDHATLRLKPRVQSLIQNDARQARQLAELDRELAALERVDRRLDEESGVLRPAKGA